MAWTIVESTPMISKMVSQAGDELIKIKLACTSDANASDHDLSAESMQAIKGSWLYALRIIPGTGDDAPTAAFNCDIRDEDDQILLSTTANSNTAQSVNMGSGSWGVFPPIESRADAMVNVACATLGNAKKADIYLYFTR